jgi:hypothetical protein
MGGEHDPLLSRQQPGQHCPPARRQHPRQIARHQGQRARQDVRQHQIVTPYARSAAAIARRGVEAHEAGDAVPFGVPAGDGDRGGIDVARPDPPAQPPGGGDREDPGARSDIARMADRPPPRQIVERQQAPAGRGVLAGAEGGCRIEKDVDAAGRHAAAVMRAVNKEPPNRERWEGALIVGKPVALGQPLFADCDQHAACGRGGQGQTGGESGRQERRRRIGFDLPLLAPGPALEG